MVRALQLARFACLDGRLISVRTPKHVNQIHQPEAAQRLCLEMTVCRRDMRNQNLYALHIRTPNLCYSQLGRIKWNGGCNCNIQTYKCHGNRRCGQARDTVSGFCPAPPVWGPLLCLLHSVVVAIQCSPVCLIDARRPPSIPVIGIWTANQHYNIAPCHAMCKQA